MSAHTEFTKHNDKYIANFGDKGALPLPPAKRLIIVTCMDARIEPFQQLGVAEGDAHVIRNAGGVARDALRSIVISQRLLGTREIAIFHHTDCGMLTFTTPQLRDIIKKAHPNDNAVAQEADATEFLEFGSIEEAVKNDVRYLQAHPLVLDGTTVTGWVYDVKLGKASQIV